MIRLLRFPSLLIGLLSGLLAPVFLVHAQELRFERSAYNPAILSFSYTVDKSEKPEEKTKAASTATAFIDVVLITRKGESLGQRVSVNQARFVGLLRSLYEQLARQESLDVEKPASPSRQLYEALIGPIAQDLQHRKISTLLIAAERGLQGVPFAALHDGKQYLGERYAFSLTPSLQFTSLGPPRRGNPKVLVAGASTFTGLAPLPLVPQEVSRLDEGGQAERRLDQQFTPDVLLKEASDPRFARVHVATHAEFRPGGPRQSVLYTGTTPMPLSDFLQMKQRREGDLLDLFSLSACRTALGDSSSEMGFAGLALQAGARSAIGTLWYVDDVATSAYFLQLYRYLDQGMPKAEALQATRVAFAQGLVHIKDDTMIGPDGAALLTKLSPQQIRRVHTGLNHPFFWAGIELLGSPW